MLIFHVGRKKKTGGFQVTETNNLTSEEHSSFSMKERLQLFREITFNRSTCTKPKFPFLLLIKWAIVFSIISCLL
jgi:hypothetical protein